MFGPSLHRDEFDGDSQDLRHPVLTQRSRTQKCTLAP